MAKNKAVMDKMKALMDDAFAPLTGDETKEEREHRKVIIRVITKLIVLRNGYSASAPFERRMWLKLRKNMLSVLKDMKDTKKRKGSKKSRRNSLKNSPHSSPAGKKRNSIRRNSQGKASPGRSSRRNSLRRNSLKR